MNKTTLRKLIKSLSKGKVRVKSEAFDSELSNLLDKAQISLPVSMIKKFGDSTLKDVNSQVSKQLADFIKENRLEEIFPALDDLSKSTTTQNKEMLSVLDKSRAELEAERKRILKLEKDLVESKNTSTSTSTDFLSRLGSTKADIEAAKAEITAQKAVIAEYKKQLENNNSELISIISQFKEETKKLLAEKGTTKDFNDRIDRVKVELLENMSRGGSMNRQILVAGSNPLTSFTDINFVAGNGISLATANDNTNKRVNLTITATSGGGNVTGPVSSTDTAVALFDGTDGQVIKNSGVLIDGSNNVTGVAALTASGALRSNTSLILEETGAGTDIITIAAPASIAASYSLTLPVNDGDSGQVLQTNGSGVTSWETVTAGAGGSTTEVQYNSTGSLAGITGATSDGTTLTLTSGRATTDFSPSTSDAATLGTSLLQFSDLYLASGGVIDFAGGDVTITHSANTLTFAGGTVALGTATATGGLTGNVTGNVSGSAATVTGASQTAITSAANLATVGTIGTGVWQGTTIKANYLQQAAADLGDADITVDLSNSNVGNVTNLVIDGALTIASFGGNWTNAGRTVADMGTLTTVDINGGTVDGVTIGGSSAGAITGTTITANTGIEVQNTDTTITRSAAGIIAVEGVAVPTISNTATLTNKAITKRVVTTTDDATAVIDVGVTDVYELSAIANNTTFSTTGSPTDGQNIVIRWKDAGVSKTLTWDAIFVAVGITLPTATTAGKWQYVGCQYNSGAAKFHAIALVTQA